MSAARPKNWGLFGGAGFIGQHLALSILQRHPQDRVFVLDLVTPSQSAWKTALRPYLGTDQLVMMRCDVRDAAHIEAVGVTFDVIVNLAAIHREPGHKAQEYFETNVPGARNLSALAEETGCPEIIFTSSISVYGVHDRPVDETDPVLPRTPYGQSKREAEEIHVDWAKRTGGRLTIVRPGVVFGHGEEGNVTRLMREMLRRNRVIRLKPDQAKDGIYIEELIEVLHWLRGREMPPEGFQLANAVSHERLSFNAFGKALNAVKPFDTQPINVPTKLIRLASTAARPFSALVPAGSRFHPERLAKIYRPNDIRPTALTEMGYPFAWPLERALADWLERGL